MAMLKRTVLLAGLLLAYMAHAQTPPSSSPPPPETVKRVCDSGRNASACSAYGLLLMRGTAVPKDEAMALLYFQMGCDKGHVGGCRALGDIARTGKLVPANFPMARGAYAKGCALKDGASCMRLGLMMGSGQGGAKDMSEAIVAVRKACEYGEKQACATGNETASAPTASERRTLTDADRRTCGIQYIGYADTLDFVAIMGSKPVTPKAIELRKRGMAMFGLAANAKLPADLQTAAGTVRVAVMGDDKAVQDEALRKMVTTIDNCNRAQGLAAIP